MKPLVLLYFTLALCLQSFGQIEKVETFKIGTKIDFYIGQCGNNIPEAQGKLTFCDRAGNLGVVKESLGLNDRGTLAMIPNFYDDTEVYLTRNGISMYKSDGSWENIPNLAFSNPLLESYNNTGTVQGGVLLPDGKLMMHVNQVGQFIHIYDMVTKELTLSPITQTIAPNFPAVRNITYDPVTGEVYGFMVSGSNRYLYKYAGGSFTLLSDSLSLIEVFTSLNVTTTLIKEGIFYVGGPNGLFTIDLDNPSTITKYDHTETDLLPFNRVNDFEIADDGMIWLAQQATNNNAGGITKFDIINETYELYTQENPGSSTVDILPQRIALNPNGLVHLSISNYGAVADLDFTGGTPTWSFITNADFTPLGVPITYTPNEVYVIDGKVFYTTNDFSTGTTNNFEVVIRDGDIWTGRNDNAPSNLSYRMLRRFSDAQPTDDGGSWWLNQFDNEVVRIDQEGTFTSEIRYNVPGSQGAVDIDQNIVGAFALQGQGSKARKIIPPTLYDYASENNGGNSNVLQYNDQIWVFNPSFAIVEIYIDNTLIQTYNLDPAISLSSYFRSTIDRDGIFWSVKTISGNVPSLLRFDSTTEALTEIVLTSTFSTTVGAYPSPDGGIWLVSSTSAIYYKDGIEYEFSNALVSNVPFRDAKVDANGKLYIFTDGAAINLLTIEDPTNANPITETFNLAENAGLLPSEEFNVTSQLLIDANGDYWINGSRGLYKFIDDDTTPFYKTRGTTTGIISGRLYADINENGGYDVGEEATGQSVAIEVNGTVINVITNGEGIYRFFAQEENTIHTVTITALDDDFYSLNRSQDISVTTLDQDYENNDFVLQIKNYNSLLFKTGDRLGLWGFSRAGFENTFTTAISNMSFTKTFNELQATYLFENTNGGELPEILNVTFTKLDANGIVLLHKYIAINPKNNRWRVTGLSSNAFTSEEITLGFTPSEELGKRRVAFTIPAIAPRDTWIVEIETDLFDPVQTGVKIVHTFESVSSPDFEEGPEGPPPGGDVYIIYPEEQRDYGFVPLPSEDLNSPYIDPSQPAPEGTFIDPSEVYFPASNESTIFSAFDPNDKLVAGGNALEINETDIARKWLTYTIRFENTGNFSAKDVYILDELEENIIPDSFTLLETSDDVVVDFLPSGENVSSILRFSFNNIFLPFDDENNDGWVKFRVRVKEDIAENTLVENTAAIYFDQNPPIITNTIQNLFRSLEVPEDTEAPNMVCKNITVFLNENGQATIVAGDVDDDSTDNEGIVNLELDITSFDCSNLGENEVVLTGTDAAGNSASCTALVTIEDEFPPEVLCRDPFSISLDENGVATITVDDIDNGSTDNCDIESIEIDVTSFDCSNVGENSVTLTVTDTAGFTVSCTTIVTVVDDILPVAICQDVTLSLDINGEATLSVEDINNGSFDNCSSVGLDLSNFAYTCDDLGTNAVTLFVTDASGNQSTCEATVTVIDEMPPTAVCEEITVELEENGLATITPFDIDLNDSIDNCSEITKTLSVDTFTCDDLGINEITLITTDASGNSNSCIAMVTVVDTITPEIEVTSVPEDQTIQVDETTMSYTMDDFTTGLIVTDNCDTTITQDPAIGTELMTGVYTVTFTVTDESGNTTTESFILSVDEALGLGENEQLSILIYPNPVQDILTIQSEVPLVSAQLYDMLGRLVRLQRSGGSIDMSDLPQAMYLLKVSSEKSTQTFQIIKR